MKKAKWSALTDIFDSFKMHLCTDFSIISYLLADFSII